MADQPLSGPYITRVTGITGISGAGIGGAGISGGGGTPPPPSNGLVDRAAVLLADRSGVVLVTR